MDKAGMAIDRIEKKKNRKLHEASVYNETMDRKGYHEGWGACLYVDWDGTLFLFPRFHLSGPRRGEP
jgi:hypothetical protein